MLDSFARFYVNGGVFMHLIFLAGLSGIGIVVVQFATLKSRFNALPMALGVLGGLLTLGVLGTFAGVAQGFEAVATASPDVKTQFIAMSISVALNTTIFSLFWLMILIPPISIAASLRSKLEQQPAPTGGSASPAAD